MLSPWISTIINTLIQGKLLTLHVINSMLINHLIIYHSIIMYVDNMMITMQQSSITRKCK